MSAKPDVPPETRDDALDHEDSLPVSPDIQDAVIAEIRQGHQILASELARLNAALAAARHNAELDATTDLRGGPIVPAYERSPQPSWGWDDPGPGRLQRAGERQPDPQRVLHLGSERNRTSTRSGKRGAIMAGATAGGVGAVVVVALAVLVLGPRLAGQPVDSSVSGVVAPVEESSAPAVVPSTAAPTGEQQSAAPTNAAVDLVLARAATEAPLEAGTQSLVDRLAVARNLDGASRAEEMADIYGIAVSLARGNPDSVAADVEKALVPEVDLEAMLTLATRRPEVVGAGVAPLVDDFAALEAAGSQEAAQAVLDQVVAGVGAGTIAGPFCNVAATVLQSYGAVMEA